MVEKKKTIDKKFIPTIIAIGILIIFFIVNHLSSNNADKTVHQGKKILDFNINNIETVVIETPESPELYIELTRKSNDEWEVNHHSAYTADVLQILGMLQNITEISQIEDYTSLNEFGLNPPKSNY